MQNKKINPAQKLNVPNQKPVCWLPHYVEDYIHCYLA